MIVHHAGANKKRINLLNHQTYHRMEYFLISYLKLRKCKLIIHQQIQKEGFKEIQRTDIEKKRTPCKLMNVDKSRSIHIIPVWSLVKVNYKAAKENITCI